MKKKYCSKCKKDIKPSDLHSSDRKIIYAYNTEQNKLETDEKIQSYNIECSDCLNKKNKKKNKLFLDDVRTIEMVYDKSLEYEFDIVRTYIEFKQYIKKNGIPKYISFDNDLGLAPNGKVAPDGLAAAKWLVYNSNLDLKDLKFFVHSANPVASEQIRGLLNNYINHLKSKELNDE
jgi:hypothetical protein